MEFTYSYLFRMISHEMKQKADQKLEQFDITNEQGHTLGYLYAHQQDGLTGVIWSLLIAESLCALAAMLIVYLLRDRLTVDTSELIEG